MIKTLKVKNLALISDLTLEFKRGFNVLLGETGAGKSIILDAIDFVMGTKADKSLISHGKDFLRVEACFEDYNDLTSKALIEMGFEDEGLIIICRTLSADGKSDIKLNGNSVTLSMLKMITVYLADSYSQHENMLLLKEKNQLAILDGMIEGLEGLKTKLRVLFSSRNDIVNQIAELGGSDENRSRELDFLQYQIQEIKDLNPTLEEENSLLERFKILSSSEKISSALENAYESLERNVSAISQVKIAQKELGAIADYSQKYSDLVSRLQDCYFEIDDIATSVRDEISNVRFDQREMDEVDRRLDRYKDIKRKYGNSVEVVLSRLEDMQKKFDTISNADEQLDLLNKKLKSIDAEIKLLCDDITKVRVEFAKKFETEMEKQFSDLGMKNGRFKVGFDNIAPTANGADGVQFLFSANLGEDLKPLSKIISGGEMSRFMLAYKNFNIKDKSTVIFDEIDAGMSGDIGSAVAKKIAFISIFNQVICISHLPQVCCMADNIFYVYKTTDNGKTQSYVKIVDGDDKACKIAKLSGGEGVSDEAIAHAKQLINWAEQYKNSIKI